MKDKIIYVAQSVRNLSIHHVRTVLPYGVILLVLGGVGFLWDGNPTEMQADSREKTQTEHASSPSFTATAQQNGEDAREGTLLFGTAAARKRHPLPDLFASAMPKRAEAGTPENGKASSGDKDGNESVGKQPAVMQFPQVCGRVQNGAATVVILALGNESKACVQGEYFGGFYISYIAAFSVVLEKDGQAWEIRG